MVWAFFKVQVAFSIDLVACFPLSRSGNAAYSVPILKKCEDFCTYDATDDTSYGSAEVNRGFEW